MSLRHPVNKEHCLCVWGSGAAHFDSVQTGCSPSVKRAAHGSHPDMGDDPPERADLDLDELLLSVYARFSTSVSVQSLYQFYPIVSVVTLLTVVLMVFLSFPVL